MNRVLIFTLILSVLIHVGMMFLIPLSIEKHVVYKSQQPIQVNLQGPENSQRTMLASQQSIFGEVLNICDQ